MRKKQSYILTILSGFMLVNLFFSGPSSESVITYACNTEQECTKTREEVKRKLEELRSKPSLTKTDTLKKQVEDIMLQLELYQVETMVTSMEVTKLKTQQENLQTSIESTKKVLKERLVENQLAFETKSGLRFIAESNSLTDFIERSNALDRLAEFDNQQVEKLQSQSEQLKKNEAEQNKKLKDIEQAIIETERLKAAKKQELESYIQEVRNQEHQSSLSAQQKRDLEESQLLAEKALAVTGDGTQDAGVAPRSATDIVATAKKYLGVPYVWGGSTPRGFDCSGLTSYVYREVTGKNIGRATYNQEHSGNVITFAQVQAGDLLFWGSSGRTYHVAIALGNNQFIHAPYAGRVVEISNFSSNRPSFALRVS